jgi:hypothetical protein
VSGGRGRFDGRRVGDVKGDGGDTVQVDRRRIASRGVYGRPAVAQLLSQVAAQAPVGARNRDRARVRLTLSRPPAGS